MPNPHVPGLPNSGHRVPSDLFIIHGLHDGYFLKGLRAEQRDKAYLQQTKFTNLHGEPRARVIEKTSPCAVSFENCPHAPAAARVSDGQEMQVWILASMAVAWLASRLARHL